MRFEIRDANAEVAFEVAKELGVEIQYTHRDGVSGFSGFSGFSGTANFYAVPGDFRTVLNDDKEVTSVQWTIPRHTPPAHPTNFPPTDSKKPTIGDVITHEGDRYFVIDSTNDPVGAGFVVSTERDQQRRSR